MTTREVGKKLENLVCDMLSDIDSKARPTKNSGASNELGDILSTRFVVECKKRNTENITLKKKTWDKLCSEVPISSMRIPLYVLQNKHNDTFVVLSIVDFINLLKEESNEDND